MLIDVSYFTKGGRKVQYATSQATDDVNSLATNEYLTDFISGLQSEFLNAMLGTELGPVITAYLDMLDNETSAEHNPDNDVLCIHLKESFADYVFFMLLRDNGKYVTTTGTYRMSSDNTQISPIDIQVAVWNDMVKRNKEFYSWANSAFCKFEIEVNSYMLKRINALNL